MIDATCPLVTKVHLEAIKFARAGYSILLIGDRDHDEVEGTSGEAPGATQVVSNVAEADRVTVLDPKRVVYLTQTTLSRYDTAEIIARLRKRFPTCRARRRMTSATPPKTGRRQWRRSDGAPTWC